MHDVFISYAREDRRRVEQLVAMLVAERGWSVWFDEALRAGDQFPRAIQDALTAVGAVLVVWSRHSIDSRWVIAEASEGWERGVLVPLRLDECEPPMPFRQTEATDFSDWRGSARAPAALKLIEAVDRVLQQGPLPDEAELLAREKRRHAYRRRKLVRYATAGLAMAALIAVGWYAWLRIEQRAGADQLAERAARLRSEVLAVDAEERNRNWGAVLLESVERLQRLELATLLAAEAVRRAPTERTRTVLDDLLAISPWSDQQLEIDHEIQTLRLVGEASVVIGGGGSGDAIVWHRASGGVTRIPHGGTGAADVWEDRRGRVRSRGSATLDGDAPGTRVATAGPDAHAVIWDAGSGEALLRLAHETTVTAVAFVPNTHSLATVSENGVVRVWDLRTGREQWHREQGGSAYWISASDSGRYLVSTSGRTARIWAAGTGTQVVRLEHDAPVAAARFSADEQLLATFGPELETRIWDMPSGILKARVAVSASERAGVAFGPDGRTVIIASTDGDLRWWSLEEDDERFSASVGSYVHGLAPSADRRRFVTAGADDIASAWDSATGQVLRQMPYPMWLRAVAMSADGRWMASSGFDGGNFVIEITEVYPEDPLEAVCRKVHRNLTRSEWREYVGPDERYRVLCPHLDDGGTL